MFGYIYVNEQELKLREFHEYRSFYCGLCHKLHIRYGRTAQLMLNYDMTFLALLLSGLYEPETVKEQRRCIPHPVNKHEMVDNAAIEYAADMSVLLAYQSLLDDWKDEKKPLRRIASSLLAKGYREAALRYPRQAKAIEKNIHLLRKAEKQNQKDIDYVAGLTGHFLSEIFVWKEDLWQNDLRTMGFYLGKFVYIMDALDDVAKDKKKGNFNLFSDYEDLWQHEAQFREMLSGMMMEAAKAFERMPVISNAEIIRNILYSGVWCKYVAMRPAIEQK